MSDICFTFRVSTNALNNDYKLLFNESPFPKWIYSKNNHSILDVNKAAIKHYGYSKKEFLKMTIKDLRPKEDIKRLLNFEKNREQKDGLVNFGVWKHKKKNGEIINVEVSGHQITYNGQKCNVAICVDITEKLKAEKLIKLNEQKLKTLLQDGSDLISILDVKGNYIDISPTSEKILGISPNYLINKNVFDLIHPNDKERVYDDFTRILKKNKIKIKAFRFLNHHDKFIWIESVLTNMLDEPLVKGIVSSARDVTKEINYEKSISQAVINTQENERFEISAELHDNVNQLLAASQIYLSTASKKIHDPNTQKLVNDSRSYILSAISEIRKLSHRLSPGFQPDFSITDAFGDLISELEIENNMKVCLEIDKNHTELPYDLKLNLYRILQEQFINILKHSKATESKVRLKVNKTNLILTTIDNGIGFNNGSTKKGIGIANMKKRVQLFLGTIDIKSDTKSGTTIKIDIPL